MAPHLVNYDWLVPLHRSGQFAIGLLPCITAKQFHAAIAGRPAGKLGDNTFANSDIAKGVATMSVFELCNVVGKIAAKKLRDTTLICLGMCQETYQSILGARYVVGWRGMIQDKDSQHKGIQTE